MIIPPFLFSSSSSSHLLRPSKACFFNMTRAKRREPEEQSEWLASACCFRKCLHCHRMSLSVLPILHVYPMHVAG